MPVVEIDTKSLNVRHSWLTDAYRLDFNLILWTDDLKNAAIEDLERLYTNFDEQKGEPKHLTMNQIQVSILYLPKRGGSRIFRWGWAPIPLVGAMFGKKRM